MAINLNDKKGLTERILPKVDFLVTSSGLQISCERITTPRFLKFDKPGRCTSCKSDSVEISFVVSKEGVWVDCNRIKGTPFVPFDIVYALPDHCIFRLKSRGHIFKIPHNNDSGAANNSNVASQKSSHLSPLKPPPATFADFVKGAKNTSSPINRATASSKKSQQSKFNSKKAQFGDDEGKSGGLSTDEEIVYLGEKVVDKMLQQPRNSKTLKEVKKEIIEELGGGFSDYNGDTVGEDGDMNSTNNTFLSAGRKGIKRQRVLSSASSALETTDGEMGEKGQNSSQLSQGAPPNQQQPFGEDGRKGKGAAGQMDGGGEAKDTVIGEEQTKGTKGNPGQATEDLDDEVARIFWSRQF